jgi:hypothetical protein
VLLDQRAGEGAAAVVDGPRRDTPGAALLLGVLDEEDAESASAVHRRVQTPDHGVDHCGHMRPRKPPIGSDQGSVEVEQDKRRWTLTGNA